MTELLNDLLEAWKKEMTADPGIPLWEKGTTPNYNPAYGQPEPSLVPFLLPNEDARRGAVIVCPGGAFIIKAPYEGRPVARWINSLGIHAFVLDYRLQPYFYWDILNDAKRAIRFIRYHANEWGILPEKIGILGFSAGGQLCVGVSTLYDDGDPNAADPIDRISCRPDAQILCYPSISLRKIDKKGSQEEEEKANRQFYGPNAGETDLLLSSAELQVKDNTPPAFLWGTADDFLYEQWLPYLDALNEKGIPREFHIFASGPHGMGLAVEHPSVSQWTKLCGEWLKSLGF